MLTAHSVETDEEEILKWDFDTLLIHGITDGRSLSYVTSRVFKMSSSILSQYSGEVVRLGRFFSRVEMAYNPSTLPIPSYHNVVHGADVTQALIFLLQGPPKLLSSFSQVEDLGLVFLSAIFAAAMHDYDHPGYTNEYMIKSRHPLALLYNDISVLENHHASSAIRLLEREESSIFTRSKFRFFRKLVVEMILSTDLSKHSEFLNSKKNDYRQTLCLALHCSDISSSARPVLISQKWKKLIWEEFTNQAKLEVDFSTGINNLCSRKSQIYFIDKICRPVFLKIPKTDECLFHLEQNRNI